MYKGKTSSYNSNYDERGDGNRAMVVGLSGSCSYMGYPNGKDSKLVYFDRTAGGLFVSYLLGRIAWNYHMHHVSYPSGNSFCCVISDTCTRCRRY